MLREALRSNLNARFIVFIVSVLTGFTIDPFTSCANQEIDDFVEEFMKHLDVPKIASEVEVHEKIKCEMMNDCCAQNVGAGPSSDNVRSNVIDETIDDDDVESDISDILVIDEDSEHSEDDGEDGKSGLINSRHQMECSDGVSSGR